VEGQLALPGVALPAAGRVLAASGGVTMCELPVRSLLNRTANGHLGGAFTLNPYRGCEFGCVFCFARYTHAWLDEDTSKAFERRVFVKTGAARALGRDLSRVPAAGAELVASTTSDPYQPAERRFGVTRSVLETLLSHSGMRLTLLTRSGLVMRDTALLARLAQRHDLTVAFSCTSLEARLLREAEPRAPSPAVRLRAMRALADAGVRCALAFMPVLPGFVDARESMEALFRAAHEAGAQEVVCDPLRLSALVRRAFVPWLHRRHPALVPLYRDLYPPGAQHPPAEYRNTLAQRVERVAKRAGLFRAAPPGRPSPADAG